MPDLESHLRQINRNIGLLKLLKESREASQYFEWIVTVQFYTCLHIIEAICATKNWDYWTHDNRNSGIFLMKELFTSEVCTRYSDLYTLSRKARYLMGGRLVPQNMADCERAYEIIVDFAIKTHSLRIG